MAQIPCLTGAAGTIVSISQNETKYFPVMHGQFTDTVSTESAVQIDMNAGGTFSKLRVRVATNSLSLASVSFRVRVNGSNGNSVVTVAAGNTGNYEDTTNSDSVSSGDLVCLMFAGDSAGGTGAMTVRTLGVDFASTTDTRTILVCGSGQGSASTLNGGTRYIPIGGSLELSVSNETVLKVKTRASCTLSNLRTYVTANARTTNGTIATRKNGADGNQAVTVTAGVTGWFEDTTNTDSASAGDDLNFKYVAGASAESITFGLVCCDYTTTDGSVLIVCGNTGGGGFTASVTRYHQLAGGVGGTGTESETLTKMHTAGTFSYLSLYVSANTSTTNGTYKIRVGNGTQADGNQNVTVTAATTGLFVDTSNTDTVASGDYVNTVFTPGDATNTLRTFSITFTADTGTITFLPISCGFF